MPFYQLKFKYEIFVPATDLLVSFTSKSPDNSEIIEFKYIYTNTYIYIGYITVFKQCVVF